MLLANTFLRNQINIFGNTNLSKLYYNIISHFRDNINNIFSIHNFINKYKNYDKVAGNWIGPYTMAKLLEDFKQSIYKLYKIEYQLHLENNITSNLLYFNEDNDNKTNTAYLLSIPVRLGLESINTNYYENILYLTKCPQFMGIIGGENNKSYYFIGSKDKYLLYLDPHHCNEYIDTTLNVESYRTSNVGYLNLNNLSPSLTLFLYIENSTDLLFLKNINFQLPNKEYSLFTVDSNNINKIATKISSNEDNWNIIDLL